MIKTDLTRTFAAIVCTVVMSATCVLGAVGPARTIGVPAPVQHNIA